MESVAVAFAVGILCPLLLFSLCWWGTATLTMYNVLRIPESGIAIAAFTGLAVGVTLDVFYLRRWINRFYRVDVRVMIPVYLYTSVVAVAFFMGLPIGNLLLGTLAGVYIGRREYYAARSGCAVSKAIRRASLFTAVVTGIEALPIGLLALNEEWVVEWLQVATGWDSGVVTGLLGIGLIVFLCIVLMAVQFWCTKTAARIAFERGR
jgi:hypothetical protein